MRIKQATLPIFPTPRIELWEGDCLELMPDIEGGSIDMVMADPPYGTTACKWDSIIPLEPMWSHLTRVIKKNGAIVLCGGEPFSSLLRISNIKDFKYDWYLKKTHATGHLNAYKMPMKKIEIASVFYEKQCDYRPILKDKPPKNIRPFSKSTQTESYGKYDDNQEKNRKIPLGKTLPQNLILLNKVQGDNFHPTQKPVALMEYLIKTYTNEGETVLDFCMGSGTTGVACKNLNRDFIGIEKDPKYFKIAKDRVTG